MRGFKHLALFAAPLALIVAGRLQADETRPTITPIEDKEAPAEDEKLAKVKEFLAGDWVAQDKFKCPVTFGKDGSFSCGIFQEKGKWVMAKGTWTIDAEGLVRARASSRGAVLGLWYRIAGDELHAPMGPNPKVVWKKVPAKPMEKP